VTDCVGALVSIGGVGGQTALPPPLGADGALDDATSAI
jgi:hypothetical protein